MKIIVLDLRNKNIEQRIVITRPGCGDGKYDSSLGTEKCDDGNNLNGDGCDQNCNIEPDWTCVNVEN
jgi:cysteine-rich repeat protein